MSVEVSKLYGLNIFDDHGAYLGKAYDLILDMESGEVVRMTTEPIKTMASSKEDAAKMLHQKSVLFSRVKSVRDIIIVGKQHI